ncbi:MauE/DoxX family redox-associated membrane protein [Thermogemmatispora sp.]|uniref:MauE/DoxX family redox-associated membrane protein n=1 Tax=Thermogemmatispora sp. TaxID=1968838 RepID=UPI0035E44F8F
MVVILFFIAVRFWLAALFLYAGLQKLRVRAGFYSTIVAFQLVPGYLARQLALFLPGAEAGCALALLLGIATRWMAFVLLAMILIFSFALAIACAGILVWPAIVSERPIQERSALFLAPCCAILA